MNKKCRKANKLLNGYIDKILSDNDKAFFEEHINECCDCKETFEAFKLLITDISEIGMQTPPADFSSKLHMRLAEEAANNTSKRFIIRPYVNIAVSAALICAVAFGANVYKDYSSQMQEQLTQETKELTAPTADTATLNINTTIENKSKNNEQLANKTEVNTYTIEKKIQNTPVKAEASVEIVEQEALPEQNVTESEVTQYDAQPATEQEDIMPDLNEADGISVAAEAPEVASSGGSGGGGGSSSAFAKRSMVFYAEYSVDMTAKSELISELKEKFNLLDDNTLICNEEEFNSLIEFLNNNDLFLDFVTERTEDNLITFML